MVMDFTGQECQLEPNALSVHGQHCSGTDSLHRPPQGIQWRKVGILLLRHRRFEARLLAMEFNAYIRQHPNCIDSILGRRLEGRPSPLHLNEEQPGQAGKTPANPIAAQQFNKGDGCLMRSPRRQVRRGGVLRLSRSMGRLRKDGEVAEPHDLSRARFVCRSPLERERQSRREGSGIQLE